MKNDGFVFVETIVAIVVLTTALLLLYTTFNNVLQKEKTRVYYDDVAYIYRSSYLKKSLNNLNLMGALKDITGDKNKYFVTIGLEYQDLFINNENKMTYFASLLKDYDVKQMIILKENKLDNLKKCTKECANDKNCLEYENCNNLYLNTSEEMQSYLKSIYIDVSCTYVLVVEYQTCSANNTNCHLYYSWVSV